MFSKEIKERQDALKDWMFQLEEEVDKLSELVYELEDKQIKQNNRVTFMDMALEAHEMDLEYLKANIKTKKKGNK